MASTRPIKDLLGRPAGELGGVGIVEDGVSGVSMAR